MKLAVVLSVSILFLLGCSAKSAFSEMNIPKNEELALENTKCGKIASKTDVDGIYTVVHLSNVYKKEFEAKEVFYIALFVKNDTKDLHVTLNGREVLELKELQEDNSYAKLLSTNSLWTKHYLAVFADEKEEKFSLVIDNGQFSSGPLNYSKELQ